MAAHVVFGLPFICQICSWWCERLSGRDPLTDLEVHPDGLGYVDVL